MEANEISSLVDLIEKDFNSRFPKYPAQTRFILNDKNALSTLSSRFEKKQYLLSIKALPYNFTTGLNFTCFEFSPLDNKSIGNDSFLVITNGDCKVISIIDPFNLKQPNDWVPPLPDKQDNVAESDNLFVLARPSVVDNLKISLEDYYPMEIRSKAFFARLGGRVGIFGRNEFGVGDGSGGIVTSCTYQTGCLWQGPFPGMGRQLYDEPQMDTALDDCEPA